MSANNHPHGDEQPPIQTLTPGGRARPGLSALLRAWTYARDAGIDAWDFALEIDELYSLGLTVSELRWLVAKEFAEHGREISDIGDPHRSFEASAGFNFDARTCLILTENGAAFAFQVSENSEQASPGSAEGPERLNGLHSDNAASGDSSIDPSGKVIFRPHSDKPHWNSARRELRFGDLLVKKFRVPARNQEWILEVFEEDGWPEHIDDPLPQNSDVCPKARLHDAIHRLNGKQVNSVLRFRGNGNGNGLFWEPLELELELGI